MDNDHTSLGALTRLIIRVRIRTPYDIRIRKSVLETKRDPLGYRGY